MTTTVTITIQPCAGKSVDVELSNGTIQHLTATNTTTTVTLYDGVSVIGIDEVDAESDASAEEKSEGDGEAKDEESSEDTASK